MRSILMTLAIIATLALYLSYERSTSIDCSQDSFSDRKPQQHIAQCVVTHQDGISQLMSGLLDTLKG